MRDLLAILAVATAVVGTVPTVSAQERPTDRAAETLDVFLDCQAPFCDREHFRREIGFVNWVRDRQDSDIHVLVTARRTAGGGWEFTLAFIGRRSFEAQGDTLRFISRNTDTDAEIRDGLAHTLALGLVPYASHTPAAEGIEVVYVPDRAAEAVQVTPGQDPWNFWTFEVSLGGSLEGEAQQSGYSLRSSLSAGRTTEEFKIELGFFGRYSRDEFELDDTTTFVNTSERFSAGALMVWSLGSHWSAGVGAEASRSTFSNRDLALAVGPALEYNIFPYQESTRRQVTFLYLVEATRFDYQERTVTGEISELLSRHSLEIGAEVRQPWGNLNGSIRAIQYLHDPAVHRIDTFGRVEIRLLRGLSFDVFSRFSRIRDQFFLPAEGLTEEEILVLRRQRETDFEFDVNVGLSFRFGSSFVNVVNPRM